jgi:hypothetical protein
VAESNGKPFYWGDEAISVPQESQIHVEAWDKALTFEPALGLGWLLACVCEAQPAAPSRFHMPRPANVHLKHP